MGDQTSDLMTARQVEAGICQINSLLPLRSVSGEFIEALVEGGKNLGRLSTLVNSDPALTCLVFSLMNSKGISFAQENYSILRVLTKIGTDQVAEFFFSNQLSQLLEFNDDRMNIKKNLVIHSISTGLFAKHIASLISPKMNPELAYTAGLLHNIGVFALMEQMPRSFDLLIAQAKEKSASLCEVEKIHLGVDHTTIGKRLAQRWKLTRPIGLAIWLHHFDTAVISQTMPEARIAILVQLACLVSRRYDIGDSGSYDKVEQVLDICEHLGINQQQLEEITGTVLAKIGQKKHLIGIDQPDENIRYFSSLRNAASVFAGTNFKLASQNKKLELILGQYNFITEFLRGIEAVDSRLDVVEKLCLNFGSYYPVGKVCCYLTPATGENFVEGLVTDSRQSKGRFCVEIPDNRVAVPAEISQSFAVKPVADNIQWLLDELDFEFDVQSMMIVPLRGDGRIVGVLLFELRQPKELSVLDEVFEPICDVAGRLLSILSEGHYNEILAERFATLLGGAKPMARDSQDKLSLDALAEMAAGAAHELNNPCSVVSGRAQMMIESETDDEKRKKLAQIVENTGKISEIIDDLMSFASPPEPKPASVSVDQIVEEARQLSIQKLGVEDIKLDLSIDLVEKQLFVDSGQIVSALANIFCNAFEACKPDGGSIGVVAQVENSSRYVNIAVTDEGVGMNTENLYCAVYPFYSSKPAGRKRGMGLAYANRVIGLNGGKLSIESDLGTGTTVRISLPCR